MRRSARPGRHRTRPDGNCAGASGDLREPFRSSGIKSSASGPATLQAPRRHESEDPALRSTHYTLQLPNGLNVVAERMPAVRSAAFQFIVPAGAIYRPGGRRKARRRSWRACLPGRGRAANSRQLSDALDALGIQRGGGAELEYATFGGALLADDLHRALELYADILRRPHLPADQFPRGAGAGAPEAGAAGGQPGREAVRSTCAAPTIPGTYGRTALGTEAGLKALTPESVRGGPRTALPAAAARSWPWRALHLGRLLGEPSASISGAGKATPPPSPKPIPRGASGTGTSRRRRTRSRSG